MKLIPTMSIRISLMNQSQSRKNPHQKKKFQNQNHKTMKLVVIAIHKEVVSMAIWISLYKDLCFIIVLLNALVVHTWLQVVAIVPASNKNHVK